MEKALAEEEKKIQKEPEKPVNGGFSFGKASTGELLFQVIASNFYFRRRFQFWK